MEMNCDDDIDVWRRICTMVRPIELNRSNNFSMARSIDEIRGFCK